MSEMAGEIFTAWVSGWPKPKGSLEGLGTGRVRESVAGSEDWRRHVAGVCRAEVRSRLWPALGVPVIVALRFYFPRPAAPAFEVPASVAVGDCDKLTRNVLDALSDCDRKCRPRGARCRKHAGVYVDDALVSRLADVDRLYVKPGMAPGCFIVVMKRDMEDL